MAFADGDDAALKQLLGDDVYDGFERAIGERETSGEKVEVDPGRHRQGRHHRGRDQSPHALMSR